MTIHMGRASRVSALVMGVLALALAGCGHASSGGAGRGRASICTSRQLTARVGFAGAALGHEGIAVYLKNDSTSPCVLDGYPSIQMLTLTGRPIPTETSTRPSYTIPDMKPQRVLLSGRRAATFFIGVTDATGYGTGRCPVSARVAITPPGNATAITLALGLSAYGGSIQHLRCGELFVSPVIAGLHRRT